MVFLWGSGCNVSKAECTSLLSLDRGHLGDGHAILKTQEYQIQSQKVRGFSLDPAVSQLSQFSCLCEVGLIFLIPFPARVFVRIK